MERTRNENYTAVLANDVQAIEIEQDFITIL
jgi:hypothetical protein